ncbi:hypothetical protein [Saliphagus sp. LR7]|uniref:hypothetical protein n=1 Tax=Saliphagus sp. LR7 TaxID=2282654 RepID=UPI0018E53D57|nr:hypothetical protein [Saliphagus sp. LR7]
MTYLGTDSSPTTQSSFRGVLEDPDFTRPVTWRTGEAENDGGETVWHFGDEVETEFFVSQPDADDLEILPHRPDDDVHYVLGAMLDRGVTEDDRLILDDGVGENSPYRVEAPEVTDFDGDRFAWYALTPDSRGEGVVDGSDGDDGGDGGGDYPVR